MTNHILKCPACKQYTMRSICQSCEMQTILPKPAKYSPEDPYGHYRREAKRPELVRHGLL